MTPNLTLCIFNIRFSFFLCLHIYDDKCFHQSQLEVPHSLGPPSPEPQTLLATSHLRRPRRLNVSRIISSSDTASEEHLVKVFQRRPPRAHNHLCRLWRVSRCFAEWCCCFVLFFFSRGQDTGRLPGAEEPAWDQRGAGSRRQNT